MVTFASRVHEQHFASDQSDKVIKDTVILFPRSRAYSIRDEGGMGRIWRTREGESHGSGLASVGFLT